LIEQNWNLVFYSDTDAIGLFLLSVIGPIGATLISNGSAILVTLHALRLLWSSDQRAHESVEENSIVEQMRVSVNVSPNLVDLGKGSKG
jgi:hypothetical protein